jgi:hypothetical protein
MLSDFPQADNRLAVRNIGTRLRCSLAWIVSHNCDTHSLYGLPKWHEPEPWMTRSFELPRNAGRRVTIGPPYFYALRASY